MADRLRYRVLCSSLYSSTDLPISIDLPDPGSDIDLLPRDATLCQTGG